MSLKTRWRRRLSLFPCSEHNIFSLSSTQLTQVRWSLSVMFKFRLKAKTLLTLKHWKLSKTPLAITFWHLLKSQLGTNLVRRILLPKKVVFHQRETHCSKQVSMIVLPLAKNSLPSTLRLDKSLKNPRKSLKVSESLKSFSEHARKERRRKLNWTPSGITKPSLTLRGRRRKKTRTTLVIMISMKMLMNWIMNLLVLFKCSTVQLKIAIMVSSVCGVVSMKTSHTNATRLSLSLAQCLAEKSSETMRFFTSAMIILSSASPEITKDSISSAIWIWPKLRLS